jgi:hypothetical protein
MCSSQAGELRRGFDSLIQPFKCEVVAQRLHHAVELADVPGLVADRAHEEAPMAGLKLGGGKLQCAHLDARVLLLPLIELVGGREKEDVSERARLGAEGLLLAVGCGGDDATSVGEGTSIEQALPAEGPRSALYAIATEIYGADFSTSTSFVQLVSSLDGDEIDLGSACEYNGRATLGKVGNWLFIMDGEQPIIERSRLQRTAR